MSEYTEDHPAEPESYLAAQRRIAASYDLALKALGVDVEPLKPDLTESQVTMNITRRAVAVVSMALIDLYLAESKLRGAQPSAALIEEFTKKASPALEWQLVHRQGTPVEELLRALLNSTPKK